MRADLSNQRFASLASMIGNTPLFEVKLRYRGEDRTVYAKAEHYNLTGSIKDRMAFHILRKAYMSGGLQPGARIVEATSGNTGISFAALGRTLGHPVTIFMPDWMSRERINLIRCFGAEIRLVSRDEGGFLGSIRMAEERAQEDPATFLPRQFSNEDNCEAHLLTTGPEIWYQLQLRGLMPDAIVAGVGTGGTVMGVSRYLKEKNTNLKSFPLEPSNSPTMSTGHKVGSHRIQGISDEFIPPIVKLDQLDQIIQVDDGDAICMAQKLAAELGLGVGISSGANLLGALAVQDLLGKDAVVVTVFADDNKKYLSTDLLTAEPSKDDFLSRHVSLLGLTTFKRTCSTCCDPEICGLAGTTEPLPACPRAVCGG